MFKFTRMICSYPISLLSYCIGLIVGDFLGGLMKALALILPSAVDRDSICSTTAALGANLFSLFLFEVIYPNVKSKRIACISFGAILFFVALAYCVLCFITLEYTYMWYSVLSMIISVYYSYIKIKESSTNIIKEHETM